MSVTFIHTHTHMYYMHMHTHTQARTHTPVVGVRVCMNLTIADVGLAWVLGST